MAVAAAAAQGKHRKYAGTDKEYAFQPLAVSAVGVWEESALRWLKFTLCSELEHKLGGKRCEHAARLMTALSVALWRGNARLLRWNRASAEEDEDPVALARTQAGLASTMRKHDPLSSQGADEQPVTEAEPEGGTVE